MDASWNLLRDAILGQKTVRTCPKSLIDVLVKLERRNQHDFQLRLSPADGSHPVGGIHSRHPHVQQSEIRMMQLDLGYGRRPAGGLSHNRYSRYSVQDRDEAFADHHVVVGDGDSDGIRSSHGLLLSSSARTGTNATTCVPCLG